MKGHLPADLAAYGAAASCYQDYFVFYVFRNLIYFQLHRLSSQKILNLDLLEHAQVDLFIYHLVDSRKDLDLAGCLLADIQELFPLLLRQCRNGDNDFLNAVPLHGLRNVFLLSYNGDSLEVCALLLVVVINDTGHNAVQVLAVFNLPDNVITCGSCPHYHGYLRTDLGSGSVVAPHDPDKPVGKSWDNHTACLQHNIDENITSGHRQVQDLHPDPLDEG